jgi:hypothetical protein
VAVAMSMGSVVTVETTVSYVETVVLIFWTVVVR